MHSLRNRFYNHSKESSRASVYQFHNIVSTFYPFKITCVNYNDLLQMVVGLKIVDDLLNKSFYKLGLLVGRHPGYFLVIPVLITLIGVTGFQKIHNNIDPEYLFSPRNGEGKMERATVESFFKVNYTTKFNVARITRAGNNARGKS